MSEKMPTIKVFVDTDNNLNFTCPFCTLPQKINVGNLKEKISPLRVRCTCKEIFSLDIDYRRFYRKKSHLVGTCRSIKPRGSKEEDILIVNLSREGIGFRVFKGQKIKVGDMLEIKFCLDDKKKTVVSKEVQVLNIENDFIGCKFTDNTLYDLSLGYYLQV